MRPPRPIRRVHRHWRLYRDALAAAKGRARRDILVTGCPRSGTKYMALLLQAYGLDVGHEEMGARGISSFSLAVTSEDGPWGPTRERYRFARVVHLVREPLATIASFAT